MTGTLIATTPKAAMHALAYQGIMVPDCFPQIRDMLRRKFGDDYVLLFAEPSPNPGDGSVDWYTPVQGEARRLAELPADEQNAIRARLIRMGTDIRRFAEELTQSPDPLKVTRGNILNLALSYPDEQCLYVVGGQPVFTCWGFGPGTPGVEAQDLCRLAAVAPAAATPQPAQEAPQAGPAAPAPTPERERRGGLSAWWLLPLLLLLLLLLLLFSSFGPLPALSGRALLHLPALPFFTPLPAVAQLERDAAALEEQLDRLRNQARAHAAACQPTQPAAEPAPAPQAVRETPEEALVIPENASDTGFLRGRWRCDTGLENARTHEPVAFEFSFDATGKGKGVVHEKHDVCTGEASASIEGGMLHIVLGPQQCRHSSVKYNKLRIDCQNSASRATRCKGTNEDGSTWDASFNRTSLAE